MLKQIFCEFILAMVKFFGWTTGIVLATLFWSDPVHTAFVLKETVRNLLPTVIVGFIFLVLIAQASKKKTTEVVE